MINIPYAKILVSTRHQDSVNTLVFAIDVKLGKDHHMVGMTCSVSDPVLLGQRCWRVDNQLICK